MYFSDLWIGFLCEQIVRQTVQISKIRCPGCESKLKSPLLHQHEQQSLLEKMRIYFEEIRGSVLPAVTELYSQFKEKLPHSDDMKKDEESYVNAGRQFLSNITSDALYYGRFQNEFVDDLIDEGFRIKKKKVSSQPPRKKQKINN